MQEYVKSADSTSKIKQISPSYVICEHCKGSNFMNKIKCEHCTKKIVADKTPEKIRKSMNPTNILKQVPNSYETNIDNLFNILKAINESQFKSASDKSKLIQSLPLEKYNFSKKWVCEFCKKTNEKILEYCESCFKNNEALSEILSQAAKVIYQNKPEYQMNENKLRTLMMKSTNDLNPKSKKKYMERLSVYNNKSKSPMKKIQKKDKREISIEYNEKSVENINSRRNYLMKKNISEKYN